MSLPSKNLLDCEIQATNRQGETEMTSPTYGAKVKYLWVFKTCGTFTEGKCHKFDNVKRAV